MFSRRVLLSVLIELLDKSEKMNIIITGCSRGIGAATIKHLASNPDHRLLALSRNEAGLQQLLADVRAENPNANLHILPLDLTTLPENKLRKAVKEKLGGLDVLINNAGLLLNKPFLELTDADWQTTFAVNVFGAVKLIRTLTPFLKASGAAHILNISSMGGFQGSSKFPGLSAYSASKAALGNLTECLAEEFQEWNIRVNCLAIGAVQTEMLAEAFPGYQAPLQPEEMAEFFAYFAVHGPRFFNGKVLPVSVSTP